MARKPPLVNVESFGQFVATVPTIDFREGVGVVRSDTEPSVIVTMATTIRTNPGETGNATNVQNKPHTGAPCKPTQKSPVSAFIFGGSDDDNAVNGSIEQFNATTNLWTEIASLLTPRTLASAVTLRDGRILIFGGYTQLGSVLTPAYNVEIFDPTDNSVNSAFRTQRISYTIPAPGPATVTVGPFTALQQPGAVYQTPGGRVAMDVTKNPGGPVAARTALRQVPGPLPGPGEFVVVPSFAVGGTLVVLSTADAGPVEISYITQSEPVSPDAPAPMAFLVGEAGGALLNDGRVAVLGGDPGEGPGPATRTVQTYDPSTGAWTLQAPLNEGRTSYDQTVQILPSGKVLVSGGSKTSKKSGSYTVFDIHQTQEIWDPLTNVSAFCAPLPTKLTDHGIGLTPDGKLLCAGGVGAEVGLAPTAKSSLYDPLTDSFSPVGTMATPRFRPSMLKTPTGVLVAGGNDQSYVDDTGKVTNIEQYDHSARYYNALSVEIPNGCGTSQMAGVALPGNTALLCGGTATPELAHAGAKLSSLVSF